MTQQIIPQGPVAALEFIKNLVPMAAASLIPMEHILTRTQRP